MSRARQVANFDPALFAADEVSGDKVHGGTISGSPTLVTPNLGTPASGTLTNATFPAGHVLQMKATTIGLTAINGGYTDGDSGDFEGVSDSDLTLNRTANTHVLYSLQGGGAYKSYGGASMFVLGRRTSGTSFTGTATDLGDSTYGHCRLYGGTDLLIPMSVVAHDSANINGNYTYRFHYRFTGTDQDFHNNDRGEINVTIIEFKPS